MRVTRQQILIVVISLVVIGTVGWFTMGEGQSQGPTKLWFYDLNKGELFAGDVTALPPIAAPSGDLKGAAAGTQAGVLATVIRIEGSEDRKIAFLQQYTPQAKELIAASRTSQSAVPADYEKIMAGTLVALPPAKPGDAITWVSMSSPDGYKITMAMDTLVGGKPYTADLPKEK